MSNLNSRAKRRSARIALPYYTVRLSGSSQLLYAESFLLSRIPVLERLALVSPVHDGLVEEPLVGYERVEPLGPTELIDMLNESLNEIYSNKYSDIGSGFDFGGFRGILKLVVSLFLFGGKRVKPRISPSLEARLARDYVEEVLGGGSESKFSLVGERVLWRMYDIVWEKSGGVRASYLVGGENRHDPVISKIISKYNIL